MATLSEPHLGGPDIDGPGDLDWAGPGPWLVLLKLLSLAFLLTIYFAKRRRSRALRGAIAMLEGALRSRPVSSEPEEASMSRVLKIGPPLPRRRHPIRPRR